MRIVPSLQPALLPSALSRLRLVLRVVLFTFGLYTIVRGIHIGKQQAAEDAAYMATEWAAFEQRLDAEMQAYQDKHDADRAEIYRGLNTIFSFANLPPIGD